MLVIYIATLFTILWNSVLDFYSLLPELGLFPTAWFVALPGLCPELNAVRSIKTQLSFKFCLV